MSAGGYKVGDFIVISDGEIEKQFEIVGVNGGILQLKDSFSTVTSSRKAYELTELVLQGIAKIVPSSTEERKFTDPASLDLSGYSDEKKDKARRYARYIKALWGEKNENLTTLQRKEKLLEIAEELGEKAPSLRTLQRQKAKLIDSGGMLRSLIDRDKAKGNRAPKVDQRLENYINQAIEKFKSDGDLASFTKSHELLCDLVYFDNRTAEQSQKLKPISLTAFIKRLEKACPEHVVKARLLKENKKIRFEVNKPVRDVKLILQRAEIDHTQLDLFVIDSQTKSPLGRPWITVLLDYKSKSVLGFYIGFEPPSYLSVAHALYHAISSKSYVDELYPEVENEWLCCGKPAVLVTDRGKEFESFALADACDDLNISLQWNPGKHPWYKGSVESYFKSLNQNLLQKQPGAVRDIQLTKLIEYNPMKNAVISLDDFLRIFHIWVIDIYQNNPVSSGTIIPNLSWKQDLDIVPISPVDPDYLKLVLSETIEVSVTNKGIIKDYIQYDNNDLKKFRMRRGLGKVKIKRDRQDIGVIRVYDEQKDQFFKVEAVYSEIASGVALYQHKMHKKVVKEVLKGEINHESLAVARMKVRDIVENSFSEYKKYKISTSRKAARYKDVGMKGDGTAVTSVVGGVSEEDTGIPKPSKPQNKSRGLDPKQQNLPESDFDGDDEFPDELEF